MMRSMFSGVSGLRIHQTGMDVIANNLANVNTPGFKASRVTFTNVFNQTLSGASGGDPLTGRGGTNPMQVGLGSNIASIDRRMTQGASMRTDNPLDLSIDGEGFFIYSDATGTFFSRSAILTVDPRTGWLVNENGMRLMGWNAQIGPGQWQIQQGNLAPIAITPDMRTIAATSTGNIEFAGNLDHQANPAERMFNKRFHDSLGTLWTIPMRAVLDGDVWVIEKGNRAFRGNDETITFEVEYADGEITFTGEPGPAILEFTEIGEIAFGTDGFPLPDYLAITLEVSGGDNMSPPVSFGQPINADGDLGLILDFSALRQFAGAGMTAGARDWDGNTAGEITGISVGQDGMVMARFSNDLIRNVGMVPLATFLNPAGLDALGNGMFAETANSGPFDGAGQEAATLGSAVLGGTLEMSNVDLGSEFTNMIVTQRGFQSNSRIIQVSDEMLAELANLRR